MDARTDSQAKIEIPSLYALKALCALFVVIIHSRMAGREHLMPLIVVAVPCFYAISGYFLYSGKQQQECRRARRWVVKALFITLFTNLGYLAFFHLLGKRYAWQDLLFNIFSGSVISVHLWYLAALWQALLLFLPIRLYIPKIIPFLPALLLLSLGMARYNFLFSDEAPAIWIRCNSLTVALPCISIGYLIAQWRERLLRLPALPLLPLLAIALTYLENALLSAMGCNNHISYLLCTPLLAATLILACLRYPEASLPFLTHIGKYHSAPIYYIHIAVAILLSRAAGILLPIPFAPIAPPFTFGISLLLSYAWHTSRALWGIPPFLSTRKSKRGC